MLQHHKEINKIVKKVAAHNNRLKYIDVNDFVKTSKDVTDSINHYQTRVYYEIAQAMIDIIRNVTGKEMKSVGRVMIWVDKFIHLFKKCLKKYIRPNQVIYMKLKYIYLIIARRKDNVL